MRPVNNAKKTIRKNSQNTSRKSVVRKDVSTRLKDRITPEIVFGFCGQSGSGISFVTKSVKEEILNYGYECKTIKVTDIIDKYSKIRNSEWVSPTEDFTVANRIIAFQDGGDYLRNGREAMLAELVASEITFEREKLTNKFKDAKFRVAWIIDSLKHPAEVELLRLVYGNMFYLFGITCPEEKRKDNLVQKGVDENNLDKIIIRDASDKEDYGQKVLDTIQEADFFVRNDGDIDFENSVARFIGLIFGKNESPSKDEYAMYIAHSVALRSACLSRQVGAAIISKSGELISTGRNDVPAPGGGLYPNNGKDARCFTHTGKECWTNKYKNIIEKEIADILDDKLKSDKDKKDVAKIIVNNTNIDNIIEYSRAVHAEMDAIVNAARTGVGSVDESTMYCTTFPCHYCVGHIIAAGILKLYYISPYKKSLAYELHSDAIKLDPTDMNANDKYLKIIPFEGVAPRQYINLFKSRGNRKTHAGKYSQIDKNKALPAPYQWLDPHNILELGVLKGLSDDKIVKKC